MCEPYVPPVGSVHHLTVPGGPCRPDCPNPAHSAETGRWVQDASGMFGRATWEPDEEPKPMHTVVLSFGEGVGPTWSMGPCPYEPDDPDRPCRPDEPGFEGVCNYYEWWEGAGQDILVGSPITFSVTQEFDPSGWGDLRLGAPHIGGDPKPHKPQHLHRGPVEQFLDPRPQDHEGRRGER